MNKHNFDYATKWEILDKKGNVVNSGTTQADSQVEGFIKFSFTDKDNNLIHESEKPMESFTVGYLSSLMKGFRIAAKNDSFADGEGSNAAFDKLYTMIGSSNAPTYVQMTRPIAPFTECSNSAFMNNDLINSTISPLKLESITETSSYIQAIISVERQIINSQSDLNYISEVCLYSCGSNMIARDTIDEPVGFKDLVNIKLTWTLRFHTSTTRTMTKNWVLNFLQNINYNNGTVEPFTGFKAWNFNTSSEISASGVVDFTGQTFTKYLNCMGDTNAYDKGIVIGSSENDVNYSDTHLGNQITSLMYNASPIPTPIADNDCPTPVIHPTLGTATVEYHRDFYNSTGSVVVVNEAGVYAKTTTANEGVDTAGSYLIARWKTGRIELPADHILRIYWQPQVNATPETYNIEDLTAAGILVLTDAIREKYPRLRNISMIEAVSAGKNWMTCYNYAKTLELGGFKGWRMMNCNATSTRRNNTLDEIRVLYDAQTDLHNLAVAQGITNDDFVMSSGYCWTEAENVSTATNGWSCYMASGNVVGGSVKAHNGRCRCVR